MAKTRSQTKNGKNSFETLQEKSKIVKKRANNRKIEETPKATICKISKKVENELKNKESKESNQIELKNKINVCVQRLSLKEINNMVQTSNKSSLNRCYDLRQREHKPPKNLKEVPKSKQLVKVHALPSINTLFSNCKNNFNGTVRIGQLILAKMKSYSPWPAKVMEIDETKKKAKVFFFGTNEHGFVPIKDCVPSEICGEIVLRLGKPNGSNSNASYSKAVRELQICNGITGKLKQPI